MKLLRHTRPLRPEARSTHWFVNFFILTCVYFAIKLPYFYDKTNWICALDTINVFRDGSWIVRHNQYAVIKINTAQTYIIYFYFHWIKTLNSFVGTFLYNPAYTTGIRLISQYTSSVHYITRGTCTYTSPVADLRGGGGAQPVSNLR